MAVNASISVLADQSHFGHTTRVPPSLELTLAVLPHFGHVTVSCTFHSKRPNPSISAEKLRCMVIGWDIAYSFSFRLDSAFTANELTQLVAVLPDADAA